MDGYCIGVNDHYGCCRCSFYGRRFLAFLATGAFSEEIALKAGEKKVKKLFWKFFSEAMLRPFVLHGDRSRNLEDRDKQRILSLK